METVSRYVDYEVAGPERVVWLKVTWMTMDDDKVCLICRGLSGRSWVVSDEMLLLEADGKPVWDLETNTSLTHPHNILSCRCYLMVETEMSQAVDITALQEYRRAIREANAEIGDFRWNLLALNMMMVRFGHLARHMGFPPEVEKAINVLTRLQFMVMQTINVYRMLMIVQAGSGPFGWLMLAAGAGTLVATGATIQADAYYDLTRGT